MWSRPGVIPTFYSRTNSCREVGVLLGICHIRKRSSHRLHLSNPSPPGSWFYLSSFSDFDTKKRVLSRNKVMTQTVFVGGSSLSVRGFEKLSDQISVVPDGADPQESYVTR